MHPDVQLTWERPAPAAQQVKGIGDARMAHLFAPGGYISGSGAGAWSGDRYQQVLRYQGWIYIGVRAIAEAFAGLMPQVGFMRSTDQAENMKRIGRKFLNPIDLRKALVSAQQQEEIEAAGRNHPLVRLLQNPNDPDVGWTFRYRTMMYLELTGNAYWWKIRNLLGQVIQMYVLPSHWMRPVGGRDRLIDAYEVRPFGGYSRNTSIVLSADDVVHFAYPGPLSVIDGWSPLQAGALWYDCAQSIDVSRLADMKNGTRARLVLALDPAAGFPPDEVMRRAQDRIEEKWTGEVNSGRPMIVEGGATPIQVNRAPLEMDYVASSDQVSRDWTLAIHRISKAVVGITDEVNYASMTASLANFCQNTLKPKLSMIGEVGSEKLSREFDESCVMYWPDPTPPDPQQINLDNAADAAIGAVTPNEVRRMRGREPYPFGGDDPMMPMQNSPTGWATGNKPEPEPVGFGDGGDSLPPLEEDDSTPDLEEMPKPEVPKHRLMHLMNGHAH